MTVVQQATDLSGSQRRFCVAIGFFDGVHLGHQQIIRQTVTDARQHDATALVITFNRHPNCVVAPRRVPPLIYSLSQKLRAVESLGADCLLLIHFDKPFSEQTGDQFIRNLSRDLSTGPSTLNSLTAPKRSDGGPAINSLCVGSNFTFGHKRSGNVELLKNLGAELYFTVHGLSAVSLDGKAVSSTRIREAIAHGDLDSASQMLGRAYSFSGTVIRGDRLGHQLGFPTANLDITGLALPPNGVYAVHAQIVRPLVASERPVSPKPSEGGSGDGSTPDTRHPAVFNLGLRPTLQNPTPELRAEVHLLDFNGDLYGQELEVTLLEKIRDEKKFPSLDDLRAQIARDVVKAKYMF